MLTVGDTVNLRESEYQPATVAEVVGIHEPFVWLVRSGERYPETYHRNWIVGVLIKAGAQ